MKLNIFPKFGKYLIFLSIILVICGAFWSIAFAKEVKIGFFDIQRIRNELPFYQRLTEAIKAKDTEFEQFRGNLYKEYLKFYQENSRKYDKEKSAKPAAEQAQITERFQTELNNKIKEINDQLEKKRLEVEAFKTEQNQAFKDRIMNLITAIAGKKKLSFVIEKDLVLYGGTDLTQDIIKQVKKDEQTNKTR